MGSEEKTEPEFLRVRTKAQRDAERFEMSFRKSPRDEAEARRSAKAATRRALGLDR